MFTRLSRKRPSHGTIVAYLALFAALATGGAYAADKITSGDIAKKAVKSKHIAKNAVKSKHLKDGGVRLKDLDDAAQGARAYGVVDISEGPDPEITTEAPSRGFASVERAAEGVYCLTPVAGGVDPDSDPAAVTPDYFHSAQQNLVTYGASPVIECDPGEYEVRTVDFTGAESDDISFGVIVP